VEEAVSDALVERHIVEDSDSPEGQRHAGILLQELPALTPVYNRTGPSVAGQIADFPKRNIEGSE
jgi:hypothetical protein